MYDQANRSKYVVTVLRDNQPLLVSSSDALNSNCRDIDLFYSDDQALTEASQAIAEAKGAIDYLLWKSGKLAAGDSGDQTADGTTEFPF